MLLLVQGLETVSSLLAVVSQHRSDLREKDYWYRSLQGIVQVVLLLEVALCTESRRLISFEQGVMS